MNWDKFERTKAYYLIPFGVWWGIGLLILFSNTIFFFTAIPLFIGGILVTRKHYKKYKKLRLGDKK